MLSSVIESQLSVKQDITKTKRYPQEISIFLICKTIWIVHIWRHQDRERGVLSNSGFILYFWSKSLVFSVTRARGVKFLYFQADVTCEWSLTNKNELQFTFDDSNSEGNKMIIKAIIVRVDERMSIGRTVRLNKYPYNDFNSFRLI